MTTLGRGGSDLTATTIGKALGLREIQVWGDICVAGTFLSVKIVLYNIYTYTKAVCALFVGLERC